MPPLPSRMRELQRSFLSQGEIVVTAEDVVIQTTLGSCVAVVLHDTVTRHSGMCHSVMPASTTGEQSLRYTDQAVTRMLECFSALGIPKARLLAKVVGGADQMQRARRTSTHAVVGSHNTSVAFACLERAGVPVIARDTGGTTGRRVLLDVRTGDVYVRALRLDHGKA